MMDNNIDVKIDSLKVLFNEANEDIKRICSKFFADNITGPLNNLKDYISLKSYKNYRKLKEELPKDIIGLLDKIFDEDDLKKNWLDTKNEIENKIHTNVTEKIKKYLLENNFVMPQLQKLILNTDISFSYAVKDIEQDFRKQMEEAMPSNRFTGLFIPTFFLNIKKKKILDNLYSHLTNLINAKKEEVQNNILKEILQYKDLIGCEEQTTNYVFKDYTRKF